MKKASIIIITLLFFCFSHIALAEEATKNDRDRFQKIDDSIVLDTHTGLMWASQDNGKDIDWDDAERYCENFDAGGYTDWRLPDLKELATLYTEGKKNKDGFSIIEQIKITDCCPWSSDTSMGGASTFSFKSGKQPFAYLRDAYQARALPVRSNKTITAHK